MTGRDPMPRPNRADAETQLESGSSAHGPDATLGSSAAFGVSTLDGSSAKAPISIGTYKLIRRLGEGGMGQVWLAEQTEPVQRTVALKLIRVGMYDDEVLQRFRAERQSLAMMDHPAIAKVFDAGATPDGQPYFVMEYVPGVPITQYCDEKKLTIRRRLELFIRVCEGVQHAHQKAIIHRDLKPANILVTEIDGNAVPRIIDFGLAKATGPQIADETMLTRAGGWVGTPGYLSPEQASGTGDVDTRTDVYSLGVILYVLLTGDQPFETAKWKTQPFYEVLRQLREVDPPRPSSKIRTGKPSSPSNAELRGMQLKQLASLLQGDLDWITLKALERDRARRYGSPIALASDIERYLNNEPIVARPASTSYRLRKYVRRHRVAVAVATTLVLLLAGVAVMQTIQVRRVRAERDRTVRERDRANRITDFMMQVFKVSDPSQVRGNNITARELLDKAAKEIDSGLANDPQAQARLLHTMGNAYMNLGLNSQAEPLLHRAADLSRRSLGPSDPETFDIEALLAWVLDLQGHYSEAEKLQRDLLKRERLSLAPADNRTVNSLRQLAAFLNDQHQYPEAEQLAREALDLAQTNGDTPGAIKTVTQLGRILLSEEKLSESESCLRQNVQMRRSMYGPENPGLLHVEMLLGWTIGREGRYSEAEEIERNTLAVQRRIDGPDDIDTLSTESALAALLQQDGHYAESEKLNRDAVEKGEKLGVNSPSVFLFTGRLIQTLLSEEKYGEAEKIAANLLHREEATLGPQSPETIFTTSLMASILQGERRYPKAGRLMQQVLETDIRVLGADDPQTAEAAYNLGSLEALMGLKDQALKHIAEALNHTPPSEICLGIETDPVLRTLHGDPRFAALVAQAKGKTARAK